MLFNTPQFFLFLLVTLGLFHTAPRQWRKPLLLAASYWFYMSWNWRFAPLLLTLTAIDYTAARWIEATADARRRKLLLIVSIAANLGFLGFFKYYNFLAGNAAAMLGRPESAFALKIVLPLGISFHTFQSISYVVDVYRRQQAAIRSVVDYALFIAFFPQLVAGPIVRAHEFFKDLYAWRAPSGEEFNRGALLVLFGLTKKMALADPFSVIADRYFGSLAAHPGVLTAWSGVLAFAVQIYFDFSGYTDMAIGMALLMGFHFPLNFRLPYLASGITEFWRRWHMSLSSWLRDYLYIALGGNRQGRLRTYLNLMATMLLGGLWHGANWKFVVWGGYHGALLGAERAAVLRIPRVITFVVVSIGWVFFRAASLQDSVTVIGRMFWGPRGALLWERWQIDLILGTLTLAILEEKLEWFERLVKAPAWVYGAAMAFLLLGIELIGVTEVAVPFVYFQF
ncbi:MAG: MBOAT family protein [Candidatus Solibacter sp.]|nr:MBOAT family protein [Candidatus Solibacter sp.]